VAGCLSPSAQAGLVRLGARLPFAEAAAELAYFWQVQVSPSTARRQTEAAGAAYEAVQAAAVAVLAAAGEAVPPGPPGPPCQFFSADGAMVPLVGGVWAEVKTLAVGTVCAGPPPGAPPHCTDLSYFSRLADAETFTHLALVETHRRGLTTAGTVVAVTDGSAWLQGCIDYHRPDAVRILDFPHAVEHLTAAAQATFGADTPRARTWVAEHAHTLKHGDPTQVLLALLDLPVRAAPQPEAAAQARRATALYLAARWEAIQYAQFQAAGYPIGDGAIESANKRIPQARLKGSGMRWVRENVNPMLALRTVAANDRWAEAWPALRAHTRTRTAARRQQSQQRRRAAALLPTTPTPAVLPPIPPLAPPPTPRPRRTTAIPALPPERARRPRPWSFQARLNARSLPDARANF
jgi:hypothetical protein